MNACEITLQDMDKISLQLTITNAAIKAETVNVIIIMYYVGHKYLSLGHQMATYHKYLFMQSFISFAACKLTMKRHKLLFIYFTFSRDVCSKNWKTSHKAITWTNVDLS